MEGDKQTKIAEQLSLSRMKANYNDLCDELIEV
jgi:hypothetical protein